MASGNFGQLVLVLGDLHIPNRACKIPDQLSRMLVPNKMQHVICTGNRGYADHQFLHELAPSVHIVDGGDDNSGSENISGNNQNPSYPETAVVQVGNFRIGVIHGHQLVPWKDQDAVDRMQRKLRVDILVTGHTHQSAVNTEKDYYHINPGSITGAYSSLTEGKEVIPSFILLAVQESKVVCYVYELVKGEVEVSKTELNKKTADGGTGGAAASSATNSALLNSLLK